MKITKESLLEAKDAHGTWYPVKVLAVDENKVHVHFCNWSSRYDTWYPINSDCLRTPKRLNHNHTTSEQKSKAPNPCPMKMERTIKSSQQGEEQFCIGSYVMAAWRNDFEYLAEVLAHRQRHGSKAEYRLRYVWDHVIEWVSISRLRKASQFEIDYVFKFIRDHGHLGSTRLPPKIISNFSDSNDSSVSNSNGSTPGIRTRPKRSKVSESKSAHLPPLTSDPSHNNTMKNSPNNGTANESKVSNQLSSLFDGIAEPNGMVYEKSILQFHEACRKRRELKRKAIEAELSASASESEVASLRSPGFDHSSPLVKVDRQSKDTSCSITSAPNITSSTEIASSAATSVIGGAKPAKIQRVSEPNLSIPHPVSSEKSELESTSAVKVKPEVVKRDDPNLRFSRTSSPATPVSKKIKHKPLVLSIPKLQLSNRSVRNSNNAQLTPTTEASPEPVVYPCPYCPRRLRHSKLLNAHIANYHKEHCVSFKSSRFRENESAHLKKPSTNPNSDADIKQTDCSLSNTTAPTRLLACYKCDTRSRVTDNEPNIIQCNTCFCWSHNKCYDIPMATESKPRSNISNLPTFHCDGCRMTLRPQRKSRANEWQTEVLRPNPARKTLHDCPNICAEQKHLISGVSSLLNWSAELRPLITTGQHMLFGNPSTYSDYPKRSDCSVDPASNTTFEVRQDSKAGRSAMETSEYDVHNSDDQLDRIYMELEGMAFQNFGENVSCRGVECNPFVISTPDSELPNNAWPLDEVPENVGIVSEAQSGEPNYTINPQDFSEPLQDLGPDILPELTGLSDDGVLCDNNGAATAAIVSDFFKVQKSTAPSELQPPLSQQYIKLNNSGNSLFNTPVKNSGHENVHSPSRKSEANLPLNCPGVFDVHHTFTDSSPPSSCNLAIAPTTGSQDIESEAKLSTNNSEPTDTEPILNLPLSASARSIMTEIFETTLVEGFVVPVSDGIKELKKPNLTTGTEFIPSDIEWIDAHTTHRPVLPLHDSTQTFTTSTTEPIKQENQNICKDMSNDRLLETVITPFSVPSEKLEKLVHAHWDLDNFNDLILTPLESALDLMESHLKTWTTAVDDFENRRKMTNHFYSDLENELFRSNVGSSAAASPFDTEPLDLKSPVTSPSVASASSSFSLSPIQQQHQPPLCSSIPNNSHRHNNGNNRNMNNTKSEVLPYSARLNQYDRQALELPESASHAHKLVSRNRNGDSNGVAHSKLPTGVPRSHDNISNLPIRSDPSNPSLNYVKRMGKSLQNNLGANYYYHSKG